MRTLALLLLLSTTAQAAPCMKNTVAVDRVSAGGDALLFCTSGTSPADEQCWWVDTKTFTFNAIGKLGPIPQLVDPRGSLDGDVDNLPKHATICPTATDCTTYTLGIKEPLVDPPTLEINRPGTLAALRWVGTPERHVPVYVVLFDLKQKKIVDNRKRSPGWVWVFDNTFLVDKQLLSATAKPIGNVPVEFLRAVSADHKLAALTSLTKDVYLVELANGKQLHKVTLPITAKEELEYEALFSPDGSRLYVIAKSFPMFGHVWVIETATGKVLGHAAPTAC